MYRGKSFRIGLGGSRKPKNVPASSSVSTLSTISETSNAPITSTPVEGKKNSKGNEIRSEAGLSRILTERANIVSQQSIQKPTQDSQSRILSNDDDFIIPASQFVQQSRYISQRSIRMRSQLSTTQQTPLSYFESVLSRCGVELTARNSDISYTLNCDHLKFVIRLRKELSSHPKYPENVQHFLSGLMDTMKTSTQLNKVLSGCMITLRNSELWKNSNESLMNDFLMIDFIQKDIIEIIMNKIKVLAVDCIQSAQMEISLLLTQLKFVDHLSHGDFVAEKIFEILELASDEARPTVIKSLEDIIDLNRHNDIIEKLMHLLPNDADLLTESTIDTFGNMCLNAVTHYMICQKIIRYIKNNAPNSLLPCFTKFILKYNAEESNQLPEIIDSLRSCLKWPAELPTTRSAIQKNQREVFGCISRSLIRSKLLFDIWLKRIQSNNDTHKPIDLILLLMMMTIKDEKSAAIENIIRRKIKADLFQVKLLEETVRLLPTILLENSVVLFELLDSFVRDRNALISNFANVGYRLIFAIESCDRKVLLSRLVGFVCERNAHAMSTVEPNALGSKSSCSDITTSALMILSEINRKHPKEMKHNGLQIMRLIENSEDFTLAQFRSIMDIICSIAYSEPPCEQLKNHIDMMVKKQVSSSIRNIKNRGIVGVIRVIDHMVWEAIESTPQPDNLDESFSSIDLLPTKLSKTAANYIEMSITSSQYCANHLALFFDELSSVFLQRNDERKNQHINKPFLIWLTNVITGYFENSFIVDELPASSANIDLEIMYSLNTTEEVNKSESEPNSMIAINVTGAVLNPSANALNSITILTSMFNLMRILYSRRCTGSLEMINAVLGSGVVLPSVASSESPIDLFDHFDNEKAKKIVDIYFYTVNVWRESVSAYVSQNDSIMRRKVLTRLTQLIAMEQKIKEILLTVPDDYVPPTCIFLTESSVSRNNILRFKKSFATKKPVAKRKKTIQKTQSTQLQYTVMDAEQESTFLPMSKPSQKQSFDVSSNLNEFLRYMDADILLLFYEKLELKYPLPEDNIGECLGLLEFKFLLEDLTQKIESIFGVHKFGSVSEVHQNITFPSNFLCDVIEVLPTLIKQFELISKHLRAIVNASNDTEISDSDDFQFSDDLFSDEANLVKMCFGLCLRLVAALFSWPGFEDENHKTMLKSAIKAIAGYNVEINLDIDELTLSVINHFVTHAETIIDLHSAVYLFHLVKSLVRYSSSRNAYKYHIVPLCTKFLSKKWYSFDGREIHGNELLEQIIKGLFKDAKFSFIISQVQTVESEIKNISSKGGGLKSMPCIKLNNFPMLYREIYTSLIETINQKLDKKAISGNQLKIWENSCKIVSKLLDIAKTLDISRIFQIYMKNTQTYIKLILQHGMTIVEANLQRNPDRIGSFLHSLQVSTRFLHALCCHSKLIKNSAITMMMPQIRESNTELVYRVKAAIAANNCSEVLWMGNLKNKDLRGDEILSQATSITRSTLSGDHVHDDVEINGGARSSTSSKRSTNGSENARPKKRKLRSIGEEYDEEETDESARSRCF